VAKLGECLLTTPLGLGDLSRCTGGSLTLGCFVSLQATAKALMVRKKAVILGVLLRGRDWSRVIPPLTPLFEGGDSRVLTWSCCSGIWKVFVYE
jgi:hypothetical protein